MGYLKPFFCPARAAHVPLHSGCFLFFFLFFFECSHQYFEEGVIFFIFSFNWRIITLHDCVLVTLFPLISPQIPITGVNASGDIQTPQVQLRN